MRDAMMQAVGSPVASVAASRLTKHIIFTWHIASIATQASAYLGIHIHIYLRRFISYVDRSKVKERGLHPASLEKCHNRNIREHFVDTDAIHPVQESTLNTG